MIGDANADGEVEDDREAAGSSPGLDASVPNVARVYDYLLGGKNNFAADRELGDQLQAMLPESSWIARENRAFVGRAVGYCAEFGLDQYLDLGSGLPTMDNVHEVVRRIIPSATVIYVDNDPVAISHASALLATSDGVTAMLGDVRNPAKILETVQDNDLLDLRRPVVVLLAAVLHFVADAADPAGIVATLRDAMAPGSYLILTTATHDPKPDRASLGTRLYERASSPLVTRSQRDIAALFTGFDMVEPGVTFTSRWRREMPSDVENPNDLYGGVGRKP